MMKSGYFKVFVFTCLFALVLARNIQEGLRRLGGLTPEVSAIGNPKVMKLVMEVNMMFINL